MKGHAGSAADALSRRAITPPIGAPDLEGGVRANRRKYGSTEEHLAKIAAKNHANGQRNPRAQSRVTPTPQVAPRPHRVTTLLWLVLSLLCCSAK